MPIMNVFKHQDKMTLSLSSNFHFCDLILPPEPSEGGGWGQGDWHKNCDKLGGVSNKQEIFGQHLEKSVLIVNVKPNEK